MKLKLSFRVSEDQDINWHIAICREFVTYHDISKLFVTKLIYHDIFKKYIRKKCQLTYCNILGRHIRDILKKYITMKYRDISVIDINDILN